LEATALKEIYALLPAGFFPSPPPDSADALLFLTLNVPIFIKVDSLK